jgi:hypothetical protein
MQISDLIPANCSVEVYGKAATVHDADGAVIAIVCAQRHNAELARLITALPALIDTLDAAIEHGMLLPVLYGLRNLNLKVFHPQSPQLQPAA